MIVNENAGSADHAAALQRAADGRSNLSYRVSRRKGDAAEMAVRAAKDGFDVVGAAGGDGTINEVVNGLMRVEERPALGVVPLGTGNDFARMLTVPPDDPIGALELLGSGEQRPMDVILMRTPSRTVYGVNAAAGGFSGRVSEALTPELKADFGSMAYLLGAATVLSDLQNYDTFLTMDAGPPKQVWALNIVVANGRTLGGGKRIASLANPEDGLLDVIVIRAGSIKEMADAATRVVAGKLYASPLVDSYRVRRLALESEPGMWFNLDGEVVTNEPVEFEVLPGALRVVVGPRYRAVVEP